MSKFEKSRGLSWNLSILNNIIIFVYWEEISKVPKLLYMRFEHFFYNHVGTFCFQTSIKTCFLDIFKFHVKKSWYVGKTCFFSSLQERDLFFYQYRFYVGVLRRLRDVSVVFDKNPLFSGFFDFFKKTTFRSLSILLLQMLWK